MPAANLEADKSKRSKENIETRKSTEQSLQTSDSLFCPPYLSPVAKKEWRRLMRLYRQMEKKILSDLDITALAIYCEAYAIYMKAHEFWVKNPIVVSKNEEDQKVLDKSFLIMQKQSTIMYRFSEQLCLTPVGRARMGMVKRGGVSALEMMMGEDDEE